MCGAMKGSKKAGSMGAKNANLPRYLCPACNGQIIGEHRFCPSCGKELYEIANMQDTKEQSGNNCTQCGVLLPIDALFCHKCGARQENTCVKCGAKLQPNAEFCNKCGANQYIGEAFEFDVVELVEQGIAHTLGGEAGAVGNKKGVSARHNDVALFRCLVWKTGADDSKMPSEIEVRDGCYMVLHEILVKYNLAIKFLFNFFISIKFLCCA